MVTKDLQFHLGNETGMEDGQIQLLLQFEQQDSMVFIGNSKTDKNEQQKRNGEVPPM
jgi:hypothetical protein